VVEPVVHEAHRLPGEEDQLDAPLGVGVRGEEFPLDVGFGGELGADGLEVAGALAVDGQDLLEVGRSCPPAPEGKLGRGGHRPHLRGGPA